MTDAADRLLAVIEQFTPGDGDYITALVAADVIRYLDDHEPGLLAEWLHENRGAIIARFIGDRSRAVRRHLTAHEAAGRFATAARSPEPGAIDIFRTLTYSVDTSNTRRRLGDMTAADHLFVAGNYDRQGRRLLMLAAFHRAIAARVPPGQTTADAIDPETFVTLRRSIVGDVTDDDGLVVAAG